MGVSTAESAISADSGAERGNSIWRKLAAARRYWWMVLAVVSLAILGGLVSMVTTPTTYVGRTSLIVSSNNRAPEQDAVLVQGYVAYFNNVSYQKQLLAEAGVDANVTVSAQAAAASPILVISTTAFDSQSAQSAAIAVGRAFRDDINKTHDERTAAALAALQDQLDKALARGGKNDQAVIAGLQDRIRQLQADQDINVLQELQSRGGVSVERPSLVTHVGLAIVGGLLLGLLAALAIARFSPRLHSRHDVADKVGLNTLVEFPGLRSKGAPLRRKQKQRMRQLANVLRANVTGPGAVVVTQATDGAATGVVARGLAIEWATQGYATVLVRFRGGMESTPSQIDAPGPGGPLDVSATLSRMRAGPVPGMSILDLGPGDGVGSTGPPALKLNELLELEPLLGPLVVIETPSVVGSATAQTATLMADATILVIDTRVAKVAETREAVGVLRQPGVNLMGAVLAPARHEDVSSGDADADQVRDQQPSPGLDRPSAPGSASWSWTPASNGSADSSLSVAEILQIPVSTDRQGALDPSLSVDVSESAQDAGRNGAGSRGVQRGKR